jgi:radical SAM protein with 4Fe4S-binding SPASM domain
LFCEIAYKGNIKEIEVFTNLSISNKKSLTDIVKYRVIISTTILAPDAETHDRLTKSKGSFDRMISNIRYLQSLRVPVNASIILMSETENKIKEILEFCDNIGINHKEPDPVRPFGRGVSENVRCKKLHNIRISPYFETSPRSFIYSMNFNSCWGNMMFLRYDGKITPCPHARDLVLGDINNESIEDIIKRALLDVWRITMDKIEICNQCEFRYMCSDCRPLAYEGNLINLYKKNSHCFYDPYKGKWAR